jgi:hypothetical protein
MLAYKREVLISFGIYVGKIIPEMLYSLITKKPWLLILHQEVYCVLVYSLFPFLIIYIHIRRITTSITSCDFGFPVQIFRL